MTTHVPVLINEVLELLAPAEGKVIIDCTLGGGGHAEELLKKLQGQGALYGIDADERNLLLAQQRLTSYKNVHFTRDTFQNLAQIGAHIKEKESHVDAILFDLGLSSMHVDQPERGFSFQKEGPLDMRFDTRGDLTAADIINTYSQNDLIYIFKTYGQERHAKKIAEEIVHARRSTRFKSTTQLAAFISGIIWQKASKVHPATRVFQALRIATNNEIEALEKGLYAAASLLSPGGRVVVISYHSLEDRIVKNFFRNQKKIGTLNVLTKKPITPTQQEIEMNRRSRSAKLRAAQKL